MCLCLGRQSSSVRLHPDSLTKIQLIRNIFNCRVNNDGRVVSNFIVQALSGKPLTVYGDGTQTRSLCFVDDLVTGLINLMNTPDIPQPVNLGNPVENTILEIAEFIIQKTDSASGIQYETLPEDDSKQRCPDKQGERNA